MRATYMSWWDSFSVADVAHQNILFSCFEPIISHVRQIVMFWGQLWWRMPWASSHWVVASMECPSHCDWTFIGQSLELWRECAEGQSPKAGNSPLLFCRHNLLGKLVGTAQSSTISAITTSFEFFSFLQQSCPTLGPFCLVGFEGSNSGNQCCASDWCQSNFFASVSRECHSTKHRGLLLQLHSAIKILVGSWRALLQEGRQGLLSRKVSPGSTGRTLKFSWCDVRPDDAPNTQNPHEMPSVCCVNGFSKLGCWMCGFATVKFQFVDGYLLTRHTIHTWQRSLIVTFS